MIIKLQQSYYQDGRNAQGQGGHFANSPLGRSSRMAQVVLEVTSGRTVGRQLQTGGSGLMMQALGVGARVALQSAS